MTPDRDTLARDLLTLPALVGAPGEVVRGLILRQPIGRMRRTVEHTGRGWMLNGSDWYVSPADLHREGWRVDLDAWGSVGPLLGLLGPALRSVTPERGGWRVGLWLPDARLSDHTAPTLAEAAARALVEVARG